VFGERFAIVLGLAVTVAVGAPRIGHIEDRHSREQRCLPDGERKHLDRTVGESGGELGALLPAEVSAGHVLPADTSNGTLRDACGIDGFEDFGVCEH
jgi:hypothetical protein